MNTQRLVMPFGAQSTAAEVFKGIDRYHRPIDSSTRFWPNHSGLLDPSFQIEGTMSEKKTAIVAGPSRDIGAGLDGAFLKQGCIVVAALALTLPLQSHVSGGDLLPTRRQNGPRS
jgi:hypothetical protein